MLKAVTLELDPGERVAVVGPNGCGKTTLLRALAGLVPLRRGEVEMEGANLRRIGRRATARKIAYMPQQWSAAFPLTCLETVLLGRSPHKRWLGLADESDVRLAQEVMERLEVWSLADRPITSVSGGELQRCLFARTLVQQGRFLLLDEPTSAQDPKGSLAVMEMLRTKGDEGVGILAAVHDLNLALWFFDRLVVLKGGNVIGEGLPESVLARGVLEEAFDVPLARVGEEGRALVVAGFRPVE